MANPILTYSAVILSPGFDLRIEGDGTPNIAGIYTDNTSLGVDLAYCRVSISYSNVSWVLNNDNSVTVTGNISSDRLVRTRAYQGTTDIDYEIWVNFNDQRTFSAVAHAETSGTYDLNLPANFSVTIPPNTTSTAASIHFFNKSIGYQYAADEFTVGLIIENPNLPDYRPGKIYNGSNWMSHNRSAGFEKIYTSASTTREMRTMNGGVGENDPPTIYNGAKKNQRKIGNE